MNDQYETSTSVPLMWTCRGNVPVDSLRYEKRWENDGKVLWLHEEWRFEDGTLARNNAHGYGYGLQQEVDLAGALMPRDRSNDVTVAMTGVGIGASQAVMR
jgi:hypothetical protein